MAAAEGDESPALYWITKELSLAARSVLKGLSEAASYGSENEMVAEMMPELVPLVKGLIKESCVDAEEEDFVAASAKAPVGHAIVAAHQFRWMVSQVCDDFSISIIFFFWF